VGAVLFGLADHAIRIAHGVGCKLLGIVVVVGGAATRRLPLMRLDQFSRDVDAHQLAVGADPHGVADVAGGHRVEGFLEADVMVGMDLTLAPVRRIEPLLGERQQRRPLEIFEDG